MFSCSQCDVIESSKSKLRRHRARVHGPMYKCDLCGKQFLERYERKRHQRNIHGTATVVTDAPTMMDTDSKVDAASHSSTSQTAPTPTINSPPAAKKRRDNTSIRESDPQPSTSTARTTLHHKPRGKSRIHHTNRLESTDLAQHSTGTMTQNREQNAQTQIDDIAAFVRDQPESFWDEMGDMEDINNPSDPPQDSPQVVIDNWRAIRTSVTRGRRMTRFNFKVNDAAAGLRFISQAYGTSSLQCLVFGVYVDEFTGNSKYSQCNTLKAPAVITNAANLIDVIELLTRELILHRDDAPLAYITNMTCIVMNTENMEESDSTTPINAPSLPNYIVKDNSIISLGKTKWGDTLNHSLSFFRCLIVHETITSSKYTHFTKVMEQKMHECREKWNGDLNFTMSDITALESTYNINIVIYTTTTTASGITRMIYRKSKTAFTDTIYLNLLKQSGTKHFSYIRNIGQYLHLDTPHTGPKLKLPDYVLSDKSLYTMFTNSASVPFNDCRSLFRCLAVKQASVEGRFSGLTRSMSWIEKDVRKLVSQWGGSPNVGEHNFIKIEDMFQINLVVYETVMINGHKGRRSVRKSLGKHTETLYLDRYIVKYIENDSEKQLNHYSYIHCFDSYANLFWCKLCSTGFKRKSSLTRHERTCGEKTKYSYSGNIYHKTLSVFEKLEEEGINVPQCDRFYPFRACFDIECYFDEDNLPNNSTNVSWTSVHVPLSISICSNVPGFQDPKCFITNGDTQAMVDLMMNYLEDISTKASKIIRKKYSNVLRRIDKMLDASKKKEPEYKGKVHSQFPLQHLKHHLLEWIDVLPVLGFNSQRYDLNILKPYIVRYLIEGERHTTDGTQPSETVEDTTPNVVFIKNDSNRKSINYSQKRGFADHVGIDTSSHADSDGDSGSRSAVDSDPNTTSAREDIEMGDSSYREISAEYGSDDGCDDDDDDDDDEDNDNDEDMNKERGGGGIGFVVKKGNSLMTISAMNIKFLDITNYLAPGFSYQEFLDAYEIPTKKGFFPYEWVKLNNLDYPELPPHTAFHSNLKNQNITEAEYQYCLGVWEENGMRTFADWLVWYNNLDVAPFLLAVQKQFDFYESVGVDIFKDAISIPGVALQYLMSTVPKDIFFSLANNTNSDVYTTIKNNITGGPSLIFSRYNEAGVTKIRANEYGADAKICQSVVGYDANALYLYSIMQEQPTGYYIRRLEENQYKPKQPQLQSRLCAEWLEYTAFSKSISITHQLNGNEHRVGGRQLAVDGYDKSTNTCYFFDGCYFHGHECFLNTNCLGEMKLHNDLLDKSMLELRQETKRNREYVKGLGYNVVVINECEWLKLKKTDANVRHFIEGNLPLVKSKAMTMEDVIAGVLNDSIFGIIECDINTPGHLRDYFSELQPIYKNTTISKDDIGEHMRDYAEKHKLLKTPQKCLIGSYFGEKVAIASPLLKWYVEHGLVVSRIYQVIQYQPARCFEDFGNKVTTARREGDTDPSKSIIASTNKLVGNSVYGKMCTNQMNHRNVKYGNNEMADKWINNPLFRDLNELAPNIYEVDMAKSKINLNLPIQVPFFVYQIAKLRMLSFYYDFIDKYIDRSDFMYVLTDTDSAYISLSGKSLDDVVIEDKREEFYREYNNWLAAEACDEHLDDFVTSKTNKMEWIQRDCCKQRKLFCKREPGIMKCEYYGAGCVALNSKTYYCFGETDKSAAKGVQKRHNQLSKDVYLNVLNTGVSSVCTNKGFRMINNHMMTYTLNKSALTYLYTKRIVHSDGVSTLPTLL